MLDREEAALAAGREHAEPHTGRAVVRRHPDHAGVMPQLASDRLGERQATVSSDDPASSGEREVECLDPLWCGGKYEAIDLAEAAMDDRQHAATSGEFDLKAAREACHPASLVRAEFAV